MKEKRNFFYTKSVNVQAIWLQPVFPFFQSVFLRTFWQWKKYFTNVGFAFSDMSRVECKWDSNSLSQESQSVLIGKKLPKRTQFYQTWSNVKMSNDPAKYEVPIKQYLHSILDISAISRPNGIRKFWLHIITGPNIFFFVCFRICLFLLYTCFGRGIKQTCCLAWKIWEE